MIAFERVKECHQSISREFAGLGNQPIRAFLGEFNTPRLRKQVKRYGDGHTLCSLPESIEELKTVDAVILVAVTSPKLSTESDFNRFTPLHTIPYWRDGKGLRPQIRKHRLHFMSWQQNFAIHGVDDAHAHRNYRLLLANSRNLESLFQREREAEIGFINSCREWFDSNGKQMIVLTDPIRKRFDEPIAGLIDDPQVHHIKTRLRGKNRTIMRKIGDSLESPEG
ncbi:MAG: hypothetical protein OXD46_09400 [Chloroflexi bacterium]|nr:hypothetical protein [Chloroflexota bacterium]